DQTTMPSFGGVPMNYASPQAIQQAYLQMMRRRQQGGQSLAAYRHPLAAVGDIAQAYADQVQLRRMMGSMRQLNEPPASTVPGLPGGDSGGDSSPPSPASQPAPQAAAPAMASAQPTYPRIPGYEPSALKRETAAVNAGTFKPVDDY